MNQYFTEKAITCFSVLALSLVALVSRGQEVPTAMALVGTNAAVTAHTAGRFPGGPDSLQALLKRLPRATNPAPAGQVFLILHYEKGLRRRKPQFLTPAASSPAAALVKSAQVQVVAQQLLKQSPSWEPGPGEIGRIGKQAAGIILPLSFGDTQLSPLAYSDDNPTFPAQTVADINGQPVSAPNLLYFLQRQIQYPEAALRGREKGVVYAYFEVSEMGAIEQQRIIGSAGPNLDAEVLRVMQLIPHALTPPRQQGQPVRVFYVQPFTFKIR